MTLGLWFPHSEKAGTLFHRMGTCCWGWSRQPSSLPWSPHHTPDTRMSYRASSWTSVPTNVRETSKECIRNHPVMSSCFVWLTYLYSIAGRRLKATNVWGGVWGVRSFRSKCQTPCIWGNINFSFNTEQAIWNLDSVCFRGINDKSISNSF